METIHAEWLIWAIIPLGLSIILYIMATSVVREKRVRQLLEEEFQQEMRRRHEGNRAMDGR